MDALTRLARTLPLVALAALLVFAGAAGGATAKKKKSKDAALPRPEDVKTIAREGHVSGTPLVLVAEAFDTSYAGRALDTALVVARRWRAAVDPAGEVARLNASAGGVRERCSRELVEAASLALGFASETDGLYDPTSESLVRAWGLRDTAREPEPGELHEALARVGWRRVLVDPGTSTIRFQRDRMGLDFDGVGRGLALDRAAAFLRTRPVRRALLEQDGDAVAFGRDAAWIVKIADPEERSRFVATIAVREAAVCTATQNGRTTLVNRTEIGPLVDPRNGAPVASRAAVTVVAKSAARAAALARALLVLGRDGAEAFLADRRDVGALWLEYDGRELRAQSWNMPGLSVMPGVRVRWLQREP